MARIVCSMAGEGRGHATRMRALVEGLRAEHQILLFAPGDAYQLLAHVYRSNNVRVHRIPGLRFHYARHGIDYFRTFTAALGYLKGLGRLVGLLQEKLVRFRPDLAITDFEPALPRAARRCGVPLLSFDHQHFLRTYDLSGLPFGLRVRAWGLARIVGLFCSGQVESVVSSFYFPPLRPSCANVTQVGVMLRPEVIAARREQGEHLLVYLRREVPENVLRGLKAWGRPVRVYGVGERPADGNLAFRPIAEHEFVVDLASCRAVVCTAGNQLVGEALYLRKPVLALPEKNNHEQAINAHFLAQSGCGEWCRVEDFDLSILGCFLDRADAFAARIDPQRVHGNPAALAAVRRHLPTTTPCLLHKEAALP